MNQAWSYFLAGLTLTVSLASARPAAGADETLVVPASGVPVSFKTRLAAGELYLLRASGVVDVGGSKLDAEFLDQGGAAVDEVAGVDVGIDVGLLQVHAAKGYKAVAPGPGRMKWFGGARGDHTHYLLVTGEGKPLALRLQKPGGAATGQLTVALFSLSPAPPQLGAAGSALDVVRVPVLKVTNQTKLVTKPGVIYLLQASGAGGVGGGGLKLGDAEYMDWTAEGTNKNEGEAGVDFGIAVDEPHPSNGGKGPSYKPRLRWWGAWRADHVYYMLFEGTGQPIALAYHDTGYGDNSKSDALTVKVFAAP